MNRPCPLLAFGLVVAGAAAIAVAQIDGTDRGVPPIDSSSDFEVGGIRVDVAAPNADAARFAGWREAQRKAWRLLWARTNGGGAPGLSDSALDAIVSGIVIENEQIGPKRYVATLGVLFDRVRAGQVLGVSGSIVRSAPLLVIPVQWSGGTPQSFESRTEWQKAWARFRSGGSRIDYVRPSGTGVDPLLLHFGQTLRPGRRWWRTLLDQYGAADVLMPQVRLERLWPGGPVIGHFSARFGPDNRYLGGFTLRASSSAGLPAMMDEAVRRMDQLFSDALARGQLRPDPSLIIEQPAELAAEETEGQAVQPEEDSAAGLAPAEANDGTASSFTVQFATPDVGAVGATEAQVRAVPGVRSVSTTSLALGGVSVMRVTFAGDLDGLRAALAARGFQVQEGGGTLRIARGGQ